MDTLDKLLTQAHTELTQARAAEDEVLMGFWFDERERLLQAKSDSMRKATTC